MGSNRKKVIAITAASVLTLGVAYFLFRKSPKPKEVPKPEEKEQVVQITEDPPSTSVPTQEDEEPKVKVTWPQLEKLLSQSDKDDEASSVLEQAVQEGIQAFKEAGGFASEELTQEEFFKVYNLIERMAFFKLRALRQQNQEGREEVFKQAFIDGSQVERKKAYLEMAWQQIEKEIQEFETVQKEILAKLGVAEETWSAAVAAYLGTEYIEKALPNSFISPFKQEQAEEVEVETILTEGLKFAFEGAASLKAHLKTISKAASEHELLVVADYLLGDWVKAKHNLGSSEFKILVEGSGVDIVSRLPSVDL